MLVYLHLAEGFEEIEAISVVDVLRRADIEVMTVSITGRKEVTGAHKITVEADLLFEEADYESAEMIILPGGMPGTINLEKHEGLKEKILQYHKNGKWLAAICAAPSIFGKLGILEGKMATSYPGFEKDLKGAECSEEPVVAAEKIITSRGPGTALSFGLELVKILKGNDLAEKLKGDMIIK